MRNIFVKHGIGALLLCGLVSVAGAQNWNAAQLEVWQVEQQQWQMAAAKDLSWIDKMVHPNITYWETEQPTPQDKASLARWSKFNSGNNTVLEQELFPLSITITGDVAVVHYAYQVASENYKKERETVTGRYTDILIKDGGRWKFIGWAGGDNPKK